MRKRGYLGILVFLLTLGMAQALWAYDYGPKSDQWASVPEWLQQEPEAVQKGFMAYHDAYLAYVFEDGTRDTLETAINNYGALFLDDESLTRIMDQIMKEADHKHQAVLQGAPSVNPLLPWSDTPTNHRLAVEYAEKLNAMNEAHQAYVYGNGTRDALEKAIRDLVLFENDADMTEDAIQRNFAAADRLKRILSDEPRSMSIDDVLEEYILNVSAPFGDRVKSAHLIDPLAVTDKVLMDQLNAMNSYRATLESLYHIRVEDFAAVVEKRNEFDDQAKVVIRFTSDRTFMNVENPENAHRTQNSTVHGLVLTEDAGSWKIARVIHCGEEHNERWQAFLASFDTADDPASLALIGEARRAQVQSDMLGLDYLPLERQDLSRPIYVKWNHVPVYFPDQQPVIQNDRVLVPIRPLVEKLDGYGILVTRPNPYTFSVLPLPEPNAPENINKKNFTFTIGDDVYAYSDPLLNIQESRPLPTKLDIMNGRTMLPVRTIGEAFGDVRWDEDTRTVYITTE